MKDKLSNRKFCPFAPYRTAQIGFADRSKLPAYCERMVISLKDKSFKQEVLSFRAIQNGTNRLRRPVKTSGFLRKGDHKMLRKGVTAAAAMFIALCLFALSGCSLKFSEMSGLLRPPKPYGTNDELQAVFEQSVGGDVLFKAPVSGDYLSSFIVEDIDGDGGNEALVFYCEDALDTTVMIGVFDYDDGQWVYVLTAAGQGCDVYSVDLCDMNSDGSHEIILSWSLFDSKSNKMLSVYALSTKDKTLTELTAEMFTVKTLADIDSDGNNEILLFHLDSSSETQTSVAKMLKMSGDGSVKLTDKKNLDGNVSGYVSVKTDAPVDDRPLYVYVDATKGEKQMITEVLYWNGETKALSVPLLDPDTQSNNLSWRGVRLESRDIDGDGITEIPAQTALTSGETRYGNTNKSGQFYITNWLRLENGKPVVVRRSFVNYTEGCIFFIPDIIADKITVVEYSETKKWDFYSADGSDNERNTCLFSLIFTTDESWAQNSSVLFEGYSVLAENGDKKVLISSVSDDLSGFDIDEKELAKCIEYYD